MADLQRSSPVERDIDQAITALKKGAHLLKYGRRGKPKFCPFRLSADESTLIWYYGKDEKHLELHHVSRIIPGQRTAVFQRYPRPEKEYQSFSLIYNDRSLDLICKDKDEAEVWFVGLKALIARGSQRKIKTESKSDPASDTPRALKVSRSSSFFGQDHGDTQRPEHTTQSRLGKAFAEVLSFTASSKNYHFNEPPASAPPVLRSPGTSENTNARTSGTETIRVSLSSGVSSSSQGSCNEDFDNLGDVFIWGEGTGSGVMGGGLIRFDKSSNKNIDALMPKALESTMVLDVQTIACGQRHAVLVTKQGEIYSWGEEAGGRLGHGVDGDIFHPKLIETLNGKSIEMVACGDYHTCAVSLSGDLYTWGDGSFNCGLLGQGSNASHWIPKRVGGPIEGLQVSFVSCGPWHTALITSGVLFTFGDGTFGALGHGDHSSTSIPRVVEALKEFQAERVACGVWHTAAVVKINSGSCNSVQESDQIVAGKLFAWGDGEYGQLGHGDHKPRLVPEYLSSVVDIDFSQVACGNNLTVALTTSGEVYTMGIGSSVKDGKAPVCIKGNLANCCVEEIACGSHHIAVLTSKAEVYTWGKGANGQLGHGDNEDRNTPTLVNFLKEKQVKSIACGSNFTAVICLHKWISSADNSVCSGCHNPFNFMRKRHNCYNCGLGFCTACSTKKSLQASLAPSTNKPYRVCEECYTKLQKSTDSSSVLGVTYVKSLSAVHKSGEVTEKEPGISRWPGTISRLSFAESMKCDRLSSFSVKPESHDNRFFPLQNGNIHRPSNYTKSPSSQYGSSPGSLSSVIPDSRIHSQSPSPASGKSPWRSTIPSPASSLSFRTHEANPDDARSSRDSLSMDVKNLRAQVESLTSKSRFLEAELGRKSLQLKEMTARAADESEKSKAAKEVIKSLTLQLKEMAERVQEKQVVCSHNEPSSNENNGPKVESSGSSTAPLSNGSDALAQISERTVQDEPGVYITLLSLQNGTNELRRVRFSRKHFTEGQAEKWWAEKGRRVCEQHNIRTTS